MKKKIFTFMTMLVMLMNTTAFADDISVYVNGNKISFTDCTPFEKDGELLLPLRSIFEALNTDVFWSSETNTVICVGKETKAIFQIGNDVLFKDSEQVKLSVAPIISENRTMVSKDAIENVFGLLGTYDSENRVISFEVK